MTSRSFATTLLALAAASSACRSSSNSNPDAKPGTEIDASSNPDDVSIFDIQDPSNKVAIGAAVTVRGVVVTAIDTFGDRTGGFWVEEPAGGAYSGVLVFGASTTDVAAIKVGDLVDITGAVKDEFALAADTSTNKTTELVKPMGGAITVTKTGTGTVPAPEAVDALAIGQKATEDLRNAEWEKWEGVLIKVSNVSANGATTQINGTPTDPTFKKFLITGGAYVESSLAAMPDPLVAKGDCLGSVTGIGDYFFDYLILPTATADIETGGTGCPAAETACDDTVDNDGNGFVDCDDNSCKADSVACPTVATTVVSIQTGVTTGAVSLSGVVVTAIDRNRKNFWVADKGAAAQSNGVYVFRGFSNTTALDASIQVGTVVDIGSGTVKEFTPTGSTNPITEVQGVTAGALTVVASTPAATQTPAVLTPVTIEQVTGVDNEKYEGVLVEIKNVKVYMTNLTNDNTATPTLTNWQVGDATTNLVVDDGSSAIATPPAAATCIASLIGTMHQSTKNGNLGHIQIEPRSAADIVTTGGTCP